MSTDTIKHSALGTASNLGASGTESILHEVMGRNMTTGVRDAGSEDFLSLIAIEG